LFFVLVRRSVREGIKRLKARMGKQREAQA